MYLHFDNKVLMSDLKALMDGFLKSVGASDRHKALAKEARDPNAKSKTSAIVTMVVNCVDCAAELKRDVTTIWQNGSPIHISLHDGVCPYCKGKSGFHYADTHSLHA
jgi:hypothetical protein